MAELFRHHTNVFLGPPRHQDQCVRTMVFTPDFSLLFCLTHFTFVYFSYPYDTNLFSYLPFILKLYFHSDRSHHEEGVRRSTGFIGW